MGVSDIHIVRNLTENWAEISKSPTINKMISVKANRDLKPLARFLT